VGAEKAVVDPASEDEVFSTGEDDDAALSPER
jgi:hypothetical protein